MNAEVLEAFDDAAVNRANEANIAAFFRTIARDGGGEVWDAPDSLAFLSGVRHPLFNGVVHARLPGPEVDARVGEILEPFCAAGMPMLWWTGADSRPAGLGEALVRRGLDPRPPMPVMGVELEALPEATEWPAGIEVAPVEDAARLRTYAEIWAGVSRFDVHLVPVIADYLRCGLRPECPMRHYVATLAGQPVATSTVQYGGGVAGIYNVATQPEARGRGVGSAVTLAALLDARTAGWRVAILQASTMGEPVYRRMGFRRTGDMRQYLLVPG